MSGCPLLDSEYAARQNGKRLPCERLADENAKLRELCASLYEFAMSEYPDGTELNFADRMCELGVEI